jgi:hypothetical protein
MERLIEKAIGSPSIVQTSKSDPYGLIFAKWFPELHNGKFLLVVVINDPDRKWIITAYSSHEMPEGDILWQEN